MDTAKELEDYRQEAHEKVNELFTEIDTLREKAHYTEAEKKDQLNRRIQELERQKDDVQQRYKEMTDQSEKSAEELKKGFERARKDLQDSWEKAKVEFL